MNTISSSGKDVPFAQTDGPKRHANWNAKGTQILFNFEERRWIYNPFFRKYLEWERNTLNKDFLKDCL